MQKVVGSSPIIRSTKAPEMGPFCCPRLLRSLPAPALARHCCPFDRSVERLAVRLRHPVASLHGLLVHAEREARVLVAELVGRVADVVAAARAAQGRVRSSQAVDVTSPIGAMPAASSVSLAV